MTPLNRLKKKKKKEDKVDDDHDDDLNKKKKRRKTLDEVEKKAMLCITSEVRAVGQSCDNLSVTRDNLHDALLNEVHLCTDCALVYNDVARLEHLVLQLCYHVVDEVGVSLGEERDRGNQ